MKVSLINFTADALNLLLRTKNTRLGFESDPSSWTEEQRQEHLSYMRDTIKSSWEFVNYTFQIEGVTRAFTHQLVRTRTGSYAQESQRTVDVSEHEVINPFENVELMLLFQQSSQYSLNDYKDLLSRGAKPGDARGLLPTNIATSITAQFNLRTLHDMAKLRLCTRTQGEYQRVFREMVRVVVAEHPWAADFLKVHCAATGTCAFPRYGKAECPVYFPGLDTSAAQAEAERRWAATDYEASPVARQGMAS